MKLQQTVIESLPHKGLITSSGSLHVWIQFHVETWYTISMLHYYFEVHINWLHTL